MDVHEYQAKEVLRKYGIFFPDFIVITSAEEVEDAFRKLKVDAAVLKVQVHAGGRGKAGGVKIAKSLEEAKRFVKDLIGLKIVNRQTGPQGVVAEKILISPLVSFKKEAYLAAILDRSEGQALLVASSEGGMEIEEVAKTAPEKILKLPIPLNGHVKRYQLYPIAKKLGYKGAEIEEAIKLMQRLAKAFVEMDATLLEINPLVTDSKGHLVALDTKLTIDDNALFRHPELQAYDDPSQISPREAQAKKYDLAYIGLEGNIGCMVNGAGLAMATMDLIESYGGSPANFLDVGGGATKEKVAEGFNIIVSDPNVKAILVNIFGGIMNCETLAEGIISATKEVGIGVPLVVRMEGTHVEEGKKRLSESGLNIILSEDLADAAKKVVHYGNMGR